MDKIPPNIRAAWHISYRLRQHKITTPQIAALAGVSVSAVSKWRRGAGLEKHNTTWKAVQATVTRLLAEAELAKVEEGNNGN